MNAMHRQECPNRELAVGWALHALEPEEEVSFAEHLPRCDDCAQRVDDTQTMAVLLAQGVEQVDPPARLREAVLAAARTPQVVGLPPQPPQPTRASADRVLSARSAPSGRPEVASAPSRRSRVLVAAAMVLVVGFGAGWVGSTVLGSGSPDQSISALSTPAVHRTMLRTPDSSAVYAVVLTTDNAATVVPVTMTAPAPGQSYWLWGVDAKGPVPLGRFELGTGAAAAVSGASTARAASYQGYAVSAEPAGTTPVRPSTVLASSATA